MSKAGAVPGGLVSEEAVRDEDFFKNKGKISETKKGKCKKKNEAGN